MKSIKTVENWFIPWNKIVRVDMTSGRFYDVLGKLHQAEKIEDLKLFLEMYC